MNFSREVQCNLRRGLIIIRAIQTFEIDWKVKKFMDPNKCGCFLYPKNESLVLRIIEKKNFERSFRVIKKYLRITKKDVTKYEFENV